MQQEDTAKTPAFIELMFPREKGKPALTKGVVKKQDGKYADTTSWPGHVIPGTRREMTRRTFVMGG